MKNLVCLLIAGLITLTACTSEKNGSLTDGSYKGVASGHNSNIEVEVSVADGKLDSVKVVEHNETRGLGDKALETMITLINENKSTNVDAVSAATITSFGVLNATRNALKEAGADDAYFKSETKVAQNYADLDSEYLYDVVVIGAGGAGLTAAIEAKAAGAKVAVIEKSSATGGNTLVSGGGLNAPGTAQQIAKGVEDSAEKFANDTFNSGDKEANYELVKVMADNAHDATEWLINDINVEFLPDRLQQFGGHSVPRAIVPVGNHGDELILKLEAAADKAGVDMFFNVKGEELIMDEGRVKAVKASYNGEEIVFNAEKGVIIATGGFASNVEMRKQYNEAYGEKFKSTARQNSTGDGIVMAENIGAALTDMEFIQVYPTCNPLTGIISYVANARFDGAVLVNAEGQRFVNEMGRRDEISHAILNQTDEVGYLFWGQEVENIGHMTEMHAVEYQNWIDSGLLHKADTIEECAKFFNIDVETMTKTIEDYNASCADGVDEDFNRSGSVRASLTAPYYIQKVVPSSHHTMGGIVINSDAAVLDTNGNVIPGLFAAGEVTGDIHGTNRLGGNAITDCVVFGRIAGQNVVK